MEDSIGDRMWLLHHLLHTIVSLSLPHRSSIGPEIQIEAQGKSGLAAFALSQRSTAINWCDCLPPANSTTFCSCIGRHPASSHLSLSIVKSLQIPSRIL